jgi:hypothetical protein
MSERTNAEANGEEVEINPAALMLISLCHLFEQESD